MKREDEGLCKAAFNGLLLQSYASGSISWEDGAEPPDFYLIVDDLKLAVEVTSLVEMANIYPRPGSLLGVRVTLDRFVKEVEAKARHRGILHGAYVITLHPVDHFGDVKAALAERILGYVEYTQSLPDTSKVPILDQGPRRTWTIEKVHDKTDYITHAMFAGKWEGEAETELYQLLTDRIADKVHRLVDVNQPKVLLILDLYHWVTSQSWHRCAERIPSVARFHTICRVWREHECEVLYSISPGWVKPKGLS